MQLESMVNFKTVFWRHSTAFEKQWNSCLCASGVFIQDGSFRTHRSRYHKDCSVNDLKFQISEIQCSSSWCFCWKSWIWYCPDWLCWYFTLRWFKHRRLRWLLLWCSGFKWLVKWCWAQSCLVFTEARSYLSCF